MTQGIVEGTTPEICRKDVISKGFYSNAGNGIKNTSIQINVQKDMTNVEMCLFSPESPNRYTTQSWPVKPPTWLGMSSNDLRTVRGGKRSGTSFTPPPFRWLRMVFLPFRCLRKNFTSILLSFVWYSFPSVCSRLLDPPVLAFILVRLLYLNYIRHST